MPGFSRRALLTGGLAIGSAAASRPSPLLDVAAAASGPVRRLRHPIQVGSLRPTTSASVMQQVELTPGDEFFMTQSRAGTAAGRDTTVISRNEGTAVSSTRNDELDAMTIIDGGHALGLHIEAGPGGTTSVWASLQGANQQQDPSGGRLARFRYTPGTFTVDTVPGGVRYLPRFLNAHGEHQESIYNFDWAKGFAIERMFDFRTGHQERYTRRRIADVLQGVDRPFGTVTLPVNPPTLQGFATVNGTFFRWCGIGNDGSGSSVAGDPMTLEQYDWTSGALIASTSFPTLGQDDGAWPDGTYEPQGCSVHREPDGSASLLVGVTTGRSGNHRWPVYLFPGVGTA